jgi:murein DD-endopeptidase MepM/ murein hydrolase activator NlpD
VTKVTLVLAQNTVFLCVLALTFFLTPLHVEASVFSSITGLFSTPSAQADSVSGSLLSQNSQKMALLQAPVNSDAQAATDEDVLVDNSALVPGAGSFNKNASTTASSQDLNTGSDNEIKTYKVQAGDTLSGIAQKFGISVNTIVWANNVSRKDTLKAGSTLVILPISGVQHKIQPGDTLSSIAQKYKSDTAEILSYNDIEENSLKVGDVIMIPDGELDVPVKPTTQPTKSHPTTQTQALGSSASGFVTAMNGYYIRPILGGQKTQGIHGNNAVDLAEACGSNIYASADGKVIVSKNDNGWNGGYGNYIVIQHNNGSQTLYGHMQTTYVSVDDTVKQGQNIGLLGNTGKVHGVTGCHVHFEIRNGIVNPF